MRETQLEAYSPKLKFKYSRTLPREPYDNSRMLPSVDGNTLEAREYEYTCSLVGLDGSYRRAFDL